MDASFKTCAIVLNGRLLLIHQQTVFSLVPLPSIQLQKGFSFLNLFFFFFWHQKACNFFPSCPSVWYLKTHPEEAKCSFPTPTGEFSVIGGFALRRFNI